MPIDTHALAWGDAADATRAEMRWMPEAIRARFPTASLAALEPELVAARVTAVVLAQVANDVRHTHELLALAHAAALPTKVIGWVPLTDPAATARTLAEMPHIELLTGVRHRLLRSDGDDYLLRPEVAESLDLVTEAGLSLEFIPTNEDSLLVVPPLVAAHPDLKFSINVLGWPSVSRHQMQPWTDYFTAAGASPNVFLKICSTHFMDGMMTAVADFGPYLPTVLEVFGADRIMIGSNWPVLTAAFDDYPTAMRAVSDTFAMLTPREQRAVQHGTAAAFYGFDTAGLS